DNSGDTESEQTADEGDKSKQPAPPAETDWVAELNKQDLESRYRAAVELKEHDDAGGVDALNAYLRILQDRSNDERSKELRDMALLAIPKIAPLLKEGEESAVVATLTQTAGDPDDKLRLRAIDTLSSLGPAAMPAFINLIKQKDNKINRLKAAEAMGAMASKLTGHVDEMKRALPLCDRDAKVLLSSVIVKAKPATPEVLPHLLQGLGTSDELIRLSAIQAMDDMGPAAKEAANALYDVAMNDPIVNVRNAANRVYTKLRPLQSKKPNGKDKQ
ncbi:MAG: HEAT repeat domain-containing protein, partial [Gemmataceae bacterium]